MQNQFRCKVTDAGRVVIPAVYRKELGISEGDEVVISRSEYGIEIMPLRQAVRRAQEAIRKYIPDDVNLLEELRKLREQDFVNE